MHAYLKVQAFFVVIVEVGLKVLSVIYTISGERLVTYGVRPVRVSFRPG